ncbi:G-protein coupled receptor 15-like [Gigantopelta aegis]|uniref:G-protein coupled receptor 15-like n=1 Tax=Gigantopelta aegis TaxID=1735272 RepID=UPI001B88B331|nr:G-protein coupled receptor 15-like [Gigantopelta aegis]
MESSTYSGGNYTWTPELTTSVDVITSSIVNDNDTTGEVWLPNYWFGFIEKPTSQQVTLFGSWLRLIGLPPILLLGVFGNVLAIAVMLRPAMRRHSYSYYLVMCAICDTVSLVVRLLFWINLLREFRDLPVLVRFQDVVACVVSEYLITANTVISSWAIVCITVERVIVVLFPLTGTNVCKPAVARKVVTCVALGTFILLCYIPPFTQYLPAVGCAMRLSNIMVHFIIATIFVSMLPLILILVGNVCIIIQLQRQKTSISAIGNRTRTSNRVTTMMLTVSLTFFVLVMPNALLVLVSVLQPTWATLDVLKDPAAFLWDINFAINFYLYIVTAGNVRSELVMMFSRGRRTAAQSRTLTTISSTVG